MTQPKDVLKFWFPEGYDQDEETFKENIIRWFRGGEKMDQEVLKRFDGLVEAAEKGTLDDWADTPKGRLALIIVLDQFSRNVYRNDPKTYANDSTAQKLTLEGIEQGMLDELNATEMIFFCLPLAHSEDLTLHEKNQELVQRMLDEAPPHLKKMFAFSKEQARLAYEQIKQFGRHPHRNKILGRESTPEETAYLQEKTPPHLREIKT